VKLNYDEPLSHFAFNVNLRRYNEGQPFPVIVDYAHSPDALLKAIKSVRDTGALRVGAHTRPLPNSS
jgi:UDP-N-acetylmuramate-alanine ligase